MAELVSGRGPPAPAARSSHFRARGASRLAHYAKTITSWPNNQIFAS
jgi:hypothetical protein